LQNISPLNTLLLSDSPLIEGTFRSSQINVEEITEEFPEQELEDILEPGMPIGNIIDKNEELDYVRSHDRIPQEIKPALLEFLEQNDELFSGEEFSSKHFPAEKYMHDVELIEPLKELKSKPFPCAGIRLQQLKETIDDLVKNKVLLPGDSEYTSPVFYVTKKAGGRQNSHERPIVLRL
jgi:hypothetical protein